MPFTLCSKQELPGRNGVEALCCEEDRLVRVERHLA